LSPHAISPHLQGEFLLIHATNDPFISPASATLMDRLTPEPKTVVTLPGGHVLPGDPAGIDAMSITARQWLAAIRAVNGTENDVEVSGSPRE
jgi:fermentation-respiration switch protein FrsA (DUF1100 family)